MNDNDSEPRTCADCRGLFVIERGEMEWFAQRGMQLPRRCKACRQARKVQRGWADEGHQ